MPDPAPKHPAVQAVALVLALSIPALLLAAVWLGDWRWAATGAITGMTALFITAPSKRREPDTPWPPREDV